jgi:hypothetical protein
MVMAARSRPDVVLGGSITRAPNGDFYTVITTSPPYPSPQTLQQIWSSATRRRSKKAWDGLEPEGALVIFWTPSPILLACGVCGSSLGGYVAYRAGPEFGIVADTSREYFDPSSFSPQTFAGDPHRRFSPREPRFRLEGEVGGHAARTGAHFRCPRCGHGSQRNLRRLGKGLFGSRPRSFSVE